MRNNKQQSPGEFDSYDPQEYRTGATSPRKSYRGIIAVLLVAVIILGGAVSTLGIMNIQLFWQLAKDNSETLPFMICDTAPEAALPSREANQQESVSIWQPDEDSLFPEEIQGSLSQTDGSSSIHGICGEMISTFEQSFYQLPLGLHIVDITPGSCAAATGLKIGDIILSIDGHEITTPQALQAFFDQYVPGAEVTITLYRNGETITMTFTLPEIHH